METLFQELLFKLENGEELNEGQLRMLAKGEGKFSDSGKIMTKLQIYADGRMQRYIDNMDTIKLIRSGVYDMYSDAIKPTRLIRKRRINNAIYFKNQSDVE